MLHLAKHVHAKFQLSSFYPEGIFDHFSSNFLRNFKNFQFCKKFQIEQPKKHISPKFKPTSIVTKISKLVLIFFFTPEIALEI
jgi:hypothetical protein